jgi:hypothetical protein
MLSIIQTIPNYQSLSSQEIQDYLAVVEEAPNMTLYNGKVFEDLVVQGKFTIEEMSLMLNTMKTSPLFEMAFISMSTGESLEFHSDARQGLIHQLAISAGWSDEFRDKVLSLGRVTQPRYVTLGLPSLPTTEEIEAALNPPVPDSQSHEVLLTVNKQPNGTVLVMARITPVGLKDGVVVHRGQPQVIMNGDLVQVVTPILEMLTNG